MVFSSLEVHYGFNETKKMTMELSWDQRVYTQLYSHGGSQSLESRPLRASLHAANRSLLLGLSAPAAVSVSVLGTATPLQSLLCSPAALQPCHRVAQGSGWSFLYRVNNIVLPTHV